MGLLLAYTLLGFLLLPPIIRAVAVKQLSKQLERDVSIEKLKLNPYTLSATVRGLLIKDTDGEPFVSWDEVFVNFQLVSFFTHPWVFKEVSVSKPFVRVEINKDYSFNFSDLLTKFATNAPPKEPSKPLALRIDRLNIQQAAASLTDLTTRTPFQRTLGPIDVKLVNFRTDPSSKNPYSVAGTTDAGGKFSWNGYFGLDPLRSEGDFSLENLALNKFAALYQDFVRFRIKEGTAGVQSSYHFEVGASNQVVWVTNTAFSVHSLKITESEDGPEMVSVPEFTMSGISANTQERWAEVGSVAGSGVHLSLRRDKDNAFNFMEAAQPTEPGANTPGGVLVLLKAVTNAVALFLNTTNAWTGAVHEINVHDCSLSAEDLANSRPVRLELDRIEVSAKNISNVPGTNLSASVSLRWNTNGAVKTELEASFSPLVGDLRLGLDQIELKPLDPYLEPKLNVFILGSKLSMDSLIRLRGRAGQLPEVTFQGNVRMDDFSTVDGVLAEDLLKWRSVRISGLEANLNPPEIAIKEIAVDDAYARAMIETNHTINLMAALRLSDTNAPTTETKEEKPAAKKSKEPETKSATANSPSGTNNSAFDLPKVSVGTVVISNAQVRFTDRSVTPNVNLGIEQAGGTITGLSSEALGQADIALHARVDNVGPVEVTGKVNLLSLRRGSGSGGGNAAAGTNDIKITVKNVDLTPTSPYVGRFAGYRLAQGKLAMDLDYHLVNRKVQSQNIIVLDHFTFGDKVNSPEATKLPVRLAVAILKDRDGKIRLDVPVEGSLDDPEFRLHKVIVHALMNMLTKIVTSPFAALSAVFGGRGEELSYQEFVSGTATMLHPEKLDSLAKGLYERPGLQLEIQGNVDPDADRQGLRHVAVEKRLRLAKWMSLRKSERETSTADQVTMTPEERAKLLKDVYAEALSKGEIPASAINAATGGNPEASAQIMAELRPNEPEKGAAVLMEKASPPASATKPTGHPAKGPEGGVTGTMEQILENSINVTDNDFRALADERAKVVRDYLIQNGKVEPERIFLAASQGETVRSQGARAYLQFR